MDAPNERNPAGGPGFEREHRKGQAIQGKYSAPRRLPPFARTITSRTIPANATLWLVAGQHAWDEATRLRDQGRMLAMLPPGDDPKRYRWDFLAGHDPVLLVKAGATQGHEIRALVEAVMSDGVGRVLDMGTMDRYVRGGAECRMS